MIVFEMNHADNKSLLQKLAAAMHVPYEGKDFITIEPPLGKGIMKILDIADELQVLLAEFTLNKQVLVTRKKSDKGYYILHFEDVQITDSAKFTVDGDMLKKSNTRHSVVRLTSNAFSNTEEVSAGTPIKIIKVFFSEAWLKKYLGLDANASGLQKYVALKTESFDLEKLDVEYLQLMDELWNVDKEDPLQNIFLQNRVTLLIERFFSRLSEKMKMLEGRHNINEEEVERLLKVEQLLIKDFSETPPTIEELSRIVSVSSTKLKKNFKEMYGSGIYAHYQKRRMERAREILLGGEYNVKNVAEAVGYVNITNFVAAFKKQFEISPLQMLEN